LASRRIRETLKKGNVIGCMSSAPLPNWQRSNLF
jgi:hypothetical protein